ncbi:MAG: PorT family protein [Bacteroidetes bacterium]|nr:PorT family protein [Bacteroidota bacterium]
MKFLISIFFIGLINLYYSQRIYIYLHGRGLLNSSFIFNNSIKTNENQSYAFALSGSGGLGASFLYENKIGGSLEFLIGNHQAKYTGEDITTGTPYSSKINLSKVQIPLLFRLDREEGYIEIGPQLNMINGANYSSNFDGFDNDQVLDLYKRASISGVFGLGSYYTIGKRRSPLSLSFGFRINYGLTDIEGVNPSGTWVIELPQKEKSILFTAGLNISFIYLSQK